MPSGSSSAPSGPSTQIGINDPWVMQQPYLNYFNRQSSNLWSDLPGTYYPGQTFAPLNPMQQLGLQERTQTAADVLPGYIGSAQNAWQSALEAPNVESNPYLQDWIGSGTNRIYQDLERRVLPAIGDQFVGANQVGSSRQGIAEGLASQGAMQAAGDLTAQMLSEGYGQGLDQQSRGLAFSPQMAQLGFMPSDVLAGVGDTLNAQAQRYYDDEMARWQYGMTEPYQRLAQTAQIPTGTSYGSTSLNIGNNAPAGGGGGGFSGSGAVGGALAGGKLASTAALALPGPGWAYALGGGLLGGYDW